MSHITVVKNIVIKDLDILKKAISRLNGKILNKKILTSLHTRTIVDYVIDFDGITIGLVKHEDGFHLAGDMYFPEVRTLVNKVYQQYTVELVKDTYQSEGYQIEEKVNKDGDVELTVYMEDAEVVVWKLLKLRLINMVK